MIAAPGKVRPLWPPQIVEIAHRESCASIGEPILAEQRTSPELSTRQRARKPPSNRDFWRLRSNAGLVAAFDARGGAGHGFVYPKRSGCFLIALSPFLW
jgi:hypothetical protein